MRILIIVARESMLGTLEELLHKNGVDAYTILSNVMGKGVTGRVYGTFLNPDINTIIFSVLPPDLADRAVSALQGLHAERKKSFDDDRDIPLKVFSFPCEEHVSHVETVRTPAADYTQARILDQVSVELAEMGVRTLIRNP